METTATGERSIQSVIATVRNGKAYAHQNRLGGVSYFTDASGKTLTYNEYDAWGNAYIQRA
ncbi:MAG: hypothetical protein FWG88_11790 [Oscillospiraceae bacterium]|nr:hypothetical protein [Oscillospiraceae bacterium]